MTKSTPGPWWTDAKYNGAEMGCAIIAARTDSGPLPGNPTRGMVAAAPRLLKALRFFAVEIGIGTDPDYRPQIRLPREAILEARAAIAEATGETP